MDHLKLLASPEFDGYREVSLSELEGFVEDKASQRAFALRFAPFYFPPFLWMFGSIVLIMCDSFGCIPHSWFPSWKEGEVLPGIDGLHFFLYFIAAFIAGLAVTFWAWKSKPISKISGKPMIPFQRNDAPPGVSEIIYVDFESRTYFRTVVAIARSGRFGDRPALFRPRYRGR